MTSIKDRLKLFEVNGPPVKPKPKAKPDIAPRNSSFTKSDINNELTNSQSEIKQENNLCRNSEILPSINANDLSNESRHIVSVSQDSPPNLQGHSQTSNDNPLVTSVSNESTACQSVDCSRDRISEHQSDISDLNSNKEINLKVNKDTGDDATTDEDRIESYPSAYSIAGEEEVDESSDKDSLYDFSYEYQGSIYHLPGLENFIFPIDREGSTELPTVSTFDHPDSRRPHQESPPGSGLPTIEIAKNILEDEPDVSEVANNLKRTASKRLIEELFNTSVWRNSVNYSDNFIFNPATTTESSVSSLRITDISSINSINSSSPSNDERRKSTTSLSSSKPNIRTLFSGMFRSKRGHKKSHEKISGQDQNNDIYDSDGHDKAANNSKMVEGDSDSVEQVTKKPLNSIFNRDWLNSLGEGIKKKANVMSELKKVFTHGKTKHLKKKPKKSISVASSLEAHRANIDKEKMIEDEDIYDDGGDDNSSAEINYSKTILPVQKSVDKIKLNNQRNSYKTKIQNNVTLKETENKVDEIYDDDGNGSDSVYDDGGEDEDKVSTKSSCNESVYDDGDDGGIENANNLDINSCSKCSSHESVYDDGGEELQISSVQSDNSPQVPDVEMRPKKINKLINNPIFNLTIPLKTPHEIYVQKHFVKDVAKGSIAKAIEVNDSIYDDGGEDYEEDTNLNSNGKTTKVNEKKHKEFTDDNRSQQRSEVSSFGETKSEKKTNQSNNVKKSHKNTSDFRWLFPKKSKSKTKSETTKDNEKKLKEAPSKIKTDKGKNKTNPPPQSKSLHQNEEYDNDDENLEEHNEPESKNELKDNSNEDMYDMDSDEIPERMSNDKDVENSKPIMHQIFGNLRNPGKLPEKNYKNQKTFDLVSNEKEDKTVSKKSKKPHKTSEIHKKDKIPTNKFNKKVLEEYQTEFDKHVNARNVSKEIIKGNQRVTDISKKILPTNKKKNVDEEYDEDALDENENEVYVSDEVDEEEKETILPKSKTIPETVKLKKNDDSNKLARKKNEKISIFSGKPKKADNAKESKTKKSSAKSKPETYIYDEDAPDENENEVNVSDEVDEEEKETILPKSKTIPEIIKSKKEDDNKKLEIKKSEKANIFCGKPKKTDNAKESKTKISTAKSKPETYIYDEDALDENENEVYVSDEVDEEEKETILPKSKTIPETVKLKKNDDSNKLARKKNEKISIFSGKPKKADNAKESKTKKSSAKSKPETYIYDEDAPNENEVYVSDVEIKEEKKTDLPKFKTATETIKSKKVDDNNKLAIKTNEKTSIFSGKLKKVAKENKTKKSNGKSKPETYIYDEDTPNESENEVYVSDEEIRAEKEINLPTSKTIPETIKSKNEIDNKKLEIKKNEKTSIFSGKSKKAADDKESKKIKKSACKTKPETLIYDEDASENLGNEVQDYNYLDDEFFNTEDPDINKIIRKNLNQAKKVFKLNDNLMPVSLSKAVKTVYSQRKNHIQLNTGELVQVLEYKDDLALVRNAVGKCGWTTPGSLQIIKLYRDQQC